MCCNPSTNDYFNCIDDVYPHCFTDTSPSTVSPTISSTVSPTLVPTSPSFNATALSNTIKSTCELD
eukprot:m.126184 g.126184  ORF g.126184 m.126184 type:complete len:66 (+) comp29184_c2_seq2:109-306(+)